MAESNCSLFEKSAKTNFHLTSKFSQRPNEKKKEKTNTTARIVYYSLHLMINFSPFLLNFLNFKQKYHSVRLASSSSLTTSASLRTFLHFEYTKLSCEWIVIIFLLVFFFHHHRHFPSFCECAAAAAL